MYKQFDSLFVSPMKIGKKYFKEYNTKIAEFLNTALTRLALTTLFVRKQDSFDFWVLGIYNFGESSNFKAPTH